MKSTKKLFEIVRYFNFNPISRQSFYGLILLTALTYPIYLIYHPSYYLYHIILTCFWGVLTHVLAEYLNKYLSFWWYLRKTIKVIIISLFVVMSINFVTARLLLLSFLSARLLTFIVQVRRRKSVREVIGYYDKSVIANANKIREVKPNKYDKFSNKFNHIIDLIMIVFDTINFKIKTFIKSFWRSSKPNSKLNNTISNEINSNHNITNNISSRRENEDNKSILDSNIDNEINGYVVSKTIPKILPQQRLSVSSKIAIQPNEINSYNNHVSTINEDLHIKSSSRNKSDISIEDKNVSSSSADLSSSSQEMKKNSKNYKRLFASNFDDISTRVHQKVRLAYHNNSEVSENKENQIIEYNQRVGRPNVLKPRVPKRSAVVDFTESTFSVDPLVMAVPMKRRLVETQKEQVLDRQSSGSSIPHMSLPSSIIPNNSTGNNTIFSQFTVENFSQPSQALSSASPNIEQTDIPIKPLEDHLQKSSTNISVMIPEPVSQANLSLSKTDIFSPTPGISLPIGKPPPSPTMSGKKTEIPFGIAFQSKSAEKKLTFDLNDNFNSKTPNQSNFSHQNIVEGFSTKSTVNFSSSQGSDSTKDSNSEQHHVHFATDVVNHSNSSNQSNESFGHNNISKTNKNPFSQQSLNSENQKDILSQSISIQFNSSKPIEVKGIGTTPSIPSDNQLNLNDYKGLNSNNNLNIANLLNNPISGNSSTYSSSNDSTTQQQTNFNFDTTKVFNPNPSTAISFNNNSQQILPIFGNTSTNSSINPNSLTSNLNSSSVPSNIHTSSPGINFNLSSSNTPSFSYTKSNQILPVFGNNSTNFSTIQANTNNIISNSNPFSTNSKNLNIPNNENVNNSNSTINPNINFSSNVNQGFASPNSFSFSQNLNQNNTFNNQNIPSNPFSGGNNTTTQFNIGGTSSNNITQRRKLSVKKR